MALGLIFAGALQAKPLDIWISSFQDQLYYEGMVKLYKETVDNEFEAKVQSFGFREMPEKLAVSVKTGINPPDVVQLDEVLFGAFLGGEVPFADLSGRIKKAKLDKDIAKSRQSLFAYKGKTYGIAQSLSAMVLYYRTDLFKEMGIDLQVVDASERFFSNLEGVTDPEEKRKVIGEQFIRVFEDEQGNCGAKFLVQGTIAPDWIESGGGERDVIKSHHNVGGLPEDVELTIVEPLREFYKDEVRQIARELGIKSSERQPFPGPGLAVRVLGELSRPRVEACREACHIVETRLREAATEGKCDLPWQYFAALLPVRSVGVHGDARVHGETVVVRAVASLDGMSARYSPIPHEVLAGISTEITNSLKGQVNRVVYDITHKPPGTIEWE